MGKTSVDLSGTRFGKLVAIEKIKADKKLYYVCLCDCGKTKRIQKGALLAGNNKSCGCLNREIDSWRNQDKRLPPGLSNARRVISYYKRNATKRGIAFKLTEKQCLEMFKKPCYYCGREPFNIINHAKSWGSIPI